MSENALDSKGELGRYSSRQNQKLTHQCEWASGMLHHCIWLWNIEFKLSDALTLNEPIEIILHETTQNENKTA